MFNRNGSNNGVHKDTAIATRNGNGHKPDAAIPADHDLLWDGLPPAVTQALGEAIDSALVSQRRGRAGRTFSYIEGHAAISEANRVFGFGGWGFELVENVTLRQFETVDSETGELKTVNAYTAPVRVTVPGAPPRTDIGFHAVTDETADGHETALKGAVTDGMKRALRSFGDRFGNGLYGDQAPVVNPPQPQRVPAQANRPARQPRSQPSTGSQDGRNDSQLETLRKKLMELCAKQGYDEAQVQAAVQKEMGKGIDDLTTDELGVLIKAAADKLNQMRQAQVA
ncbi:MAG: RAD52 family DNA repair protein [Chloroflexota bacterium]|nr:RAD52 family DNA repair protein [Chloroflexota bacterium]